MATTPISIEDYLKTTFRPQREYVHGMLKERSTPDTNHRAWMYALSEWFGKHKQQWGIQTLRQMRVKVAADQVRIPDFVLVSRQAPAERFLTHPPLAVFEIPCPDDTIPDLTERLEAYDTMGIRAVWVIYPIYGRDLVFRRYSQGKLADATRFELPGTGFSVPMSEIARFYPF